MTAFGVVVMAKAPVPGRVKTRLRPHFSDEEAAALAAASLTDSLAVAAAVATRVVVALDRCGTSATPRELAGVEVIEQRGTGLGERLDHALGTVWKHDPGPLLVIGMDTPQVTAELLLGIIELAVRDDDAAIGPATDGGFWALAFGGSAPKPVLGSVPMSQPDTGRRAVVALRGAGFKVHIGTALEDVDDAHAAARVASIAPWTRFARLHRELTWES